MTKLIKSKYIHHTDIPFFYMDRCLRLFPQFIFYLLLSILSHIYFEGVNGFGLIKLLANALLIPLNFFTVYHYDLLIIPQSWSLGLEMQFYIFIPLILMYLNKNIISILSIIFFIIAFFGVINTDFWGYRMLPGTIFIFLTGSMLATPKVSKNTLISIYTCCVVGLIFRLSTNVVSFDFNLEMLFGITIGVPAIYTINLLKINSRIDSMLGNISYGVYLSHSFFFFTYTKLNIDVLHPRGIILVVASSLLLSYISYRLIEQPIYSIRHKFRQRIYEKNAQISYI